MSTLNKLLHIVKLFAGFIEPYARAYFQLKRHFQSESSEYSHIDTFDALSCSHRSIRPRLFSSPFNAVKNIVSILKS